MTDRIRLDQWLWAARFYRTRAMAKTAIDAGQIEVEGQRSKPSRPVRLGDRIRLSRPLFTIDVDVIGLSDIRKDATAAALLYRETPESLELRTRLVAAQKLARAGLVPPSTKPEKHERREIRKLKTMDGEG
jgi:ribosome-associated heat shock protein Hsp15